MTSLLFDVYLKALRILGCGRLFRMDNPQYVEDGVITYHCPWFSNPEDSFLSSYKRINEVLNLPRGEDRNTSWRCYIYTSLLKNSLQSRSGTVIECGVERGFNILVALDFLKQTSPALLNNITELTLCDTFSGWPEGQESGLELAHNPVAGRQPKLIDSPDTFMSRISEYLPERKIRILQGILPDSLNRLKPCLISFLSLDLNYAKPECEIISRLYGAILSGSPVLLDDYCYSEIYMQHFLSHSALATQLGYTIIPIPSGQGLIVKP
jgi:O-methyltransferase